MIRFLRETAKEIALTEIKTPKIKGNFEKNDRRSFQRPRRRGFGGATNRPTASNIYRMKKYTENKTAKELKGNWQRKKK